jgi:hypothetical protein
MLYNKFNVIQRISHRIEEAKNQIHESHNRAFIDSVLIEIYTLNWVLNETGFNNKGYLRGTKSWVLNYVIIRQYYVTCKQSIAFDTFYTPMSHTFYIFSFVRYNLLLINCDVRNEY